MTFWAGLGAIRRDAFLAVGGFDEQHFPYPSIEDIDLGIRLVASGRRILLDPAIQGKHLKRWTLASMVRTDLVRRGIPWARLVLERRAPSTTLNLGWRHRASAAASLLFLTALIRRRPRQAAVGIASQCALNYSFYALLLRKRGWRQLATGVPLHMVHNLTAAAALPAAAAISVRDRLRGRGRRRCVGYRHDGERNG
jgi:GT2 family glycosyltransferase